MIKVSCKVRIRVKGAECWAIVPLNNEYVNIVHPFIMFHVPIVHILFLYITAMTVND